MKIIGGFLGVAAVLLSGTVAAQYYGQDSQAMPPPPAPAEEESRAASGGVFLNPLGMLLGAFNGEVGIGLTDMLSLNVSGSYYSLSAGSTDTTAFGIGVGTQIFPSGYLYQGFFVYPSLQYASATAKSDGSMYGGSTTEATATLMGIAALLGYQWDWRPFSLRLGGGVGYYGVAAESGDAEVALSGVMPLLDASLGFTF